jgi:outer membrane autotransporter protein
MTAALMGFSSDLSALHNRVADLRWVEEPGETIEPAAWTGTPASGLRPWLHLTGAKQDISSDTPFDQRVAKLEGGVDAGFTLSDGARAVVGGFAGAGRAEQNFDDSTSDADSDMALAGVYGGYRRGALYGNAILKYEHHWAELNSVATDADGANFDVDLFGGSLESGYRFAVGGSYLQPRLRVSYAHGWASDFADSSGEVIDLKNADSLLGDAAARLGFRPGDEARVSDVYAEAGVRHEFLGDMQAEVSSLIYTDALPGTAAFVSGGLSASLLEDKLLLSLEAGYAKGEEADEITATGALRLVY